MKKILGCLIFAGVAFAFAACSPMESKKSGIGPLPNFNDIQFEAIVSTDPATPYRAILKATIPGVVPIWEIDGKPVPGDYKYDAMLAGTYTVNAIGVYNKGGMSMGTTPKPVTFTVEKGMADVFLTNEPWVWDQKTQGHWGNGSATSTAPEWDNAAPNSRPAEQYDDVMYFNPDGTFVLDTNGHVVANEEPLKAGLFGPEWTTATTSTVIPYTMPADADWKWQIVKVEGASNPFISFSGGAFPSYVPSDSYPTDKYEILTLNETTLYIRVMYEWGGWYMRFTHPEE